MTDIERCAREHGDIAREYERGGNAAAAAELRRVENLLWALARGEPWSTVLQKPDEIAKARADAAAADHDFAGDGFDCELCGEGYCYYLHTDRPEYEP